MLVVRSACASFASAIAWHSAHVSTAHYSQVIPRKDIHSKGPGVPSSPTCCCVLPPVTSSPACHPLLRCVNTALPGLLCSAGPCGFRERPRNRRIHRLHRTLVQELKMLFRNLSVTNLREIYL